MQLKLLLRIMKLTAALLLVAGLNVNATGFGQLITLSEKHVPLQKVFLEIKKQTGYTFAYTESALTTAHEVTVQVRDATLEQVLNICLKDLPLSYKIIDNTVVIRIAEEANAPKVNSVPPPIDVKGTVLGPDKQPLQGISVTVKGTQIGTSTNEAGEFILPNLKDDAVLVFTGINIETFEARVDGRNTLQLTASLKVSQLQDVALIVTGYQKTEKRKLIGAVNVVKGEDLKDIPTNGSFEKSLAGTVPGLYVRSNSGRPGESGSVQIRGINTLTGNREPLWVLDGMPLPTGEISSSVNELLTRGLGNIPPEDIESISILKDATASAIYGAREANGVIVITTKQGKAGKSYISYSGRYSVSEKPKSQFHFMNTDEKIAFERSLFSDFKDSYGGRVVKLLNAVEKGTMTKGDAESSISQLAGTNTNWMDEIMQNASSQQHVLSLSGGNEKTQYYSSLNYTKADGVLKTNSY